MAEKMNTIGRIAAVITSMILAALLVNIWFLNAKAYEQKAETLGPKTFDYRQIERHPIEFDGHSTQLLNVDLEEAVPLQDVVDQLDQIDRRGEPVALIYQQKLYAIDKFGKILTTADSFDYSDLPVITGEFMLVDTKNMCLVDNGIKNALIFLRHAQKIPEINGLLSGLKISRDGLIAYMNWGHVIPIILGSGDWQQKLDILYAYYQHLGAANLSKQAKYLDLRVEGRVIVKKNV